MRPAVLFLSATLENFERAVDGESAGPLSHFRGEQAASLAKILS